MPGRRPSKVLMNLLGWRGKRLKARQTKSFNEAVVKPTKTNLNAALKDLREYRENLLMHAEKIKERGEKPSPFLSFELKRTGTFIKRLERELELAQKSKLPTQYKFEKY